MLALNAFGYTHVHVQCIYNNSGREGEGKYIHLRCFVYSNRGDGEERRKIVVSSICIMAKR